MKTDYNRQIIDVTGGLIMLSEPSPQQEEEKEDAYKQEKHWHWHWLHPLSLHECRIASSRQGCIGIPRGAKSTISCK